MNGLPILFLGLALAADPIALPPDVYEMTSREFNIPVTFAENRKADIKRLRLFVSTDIGKTWKHYKDATAADDKIHFKADKDGFVQFALQIESNNGKIEPATDKLEASMKVFVNSERKALKASDPIEELRKEVAELRKRVQELEKRVSPPLLPPIPKTDEIDLGNRISAPVRVILENAESVEVFSLHPVKPETEPKDGFHGYKSFGSVKVAKAETRKEVVTKFIKGVMDYKGDGFRCFDPRHGLRVTAGGKTVDFVICFECANVRVYVGDENQTGFFIGPGPHDLLTKLLKDAKIELTRE